MHRRHLFQIAAAAPMLTVPRLSSAQGSRALKYVPYTDVAVLDPIWSTAYVTRDHAAMVYDTLFALDEKLTPQHQMLEGHSVSDDGLRWTLVLRPGLFFHDGEPVLARDCVASVTRWARRDSFGQALMAVTEELSAPDDRTIQFRLKKPFGLLPYALARNGAPYPAIMPERLAKTDAFTQLTEITGSGPFRFKADERVAGVRTVYTRFEKYNPRQGGTPSGTAGPKIVHFDRVEWLVQPDPGTAVNALIAGEVDMFYNPPTDLLPLLKRSSELRVYQNDPLGNIAIMRVNHLHPPFNNQGVRRAVLSAIHQEDFMLAMMGDDRALWRDGIGLFPPGTPMASEAGLEILRSPKKPEEAKRALEAAGYKGERALVMISTDSPKLQAIGEVAADLMRRIGMNVDQQTMDWGTVVQRRAKKEPVDQGGWSAFFTTFGGQDMLDPAGFLALRGSGERAWFGWPTNQKLESLRTQWLESNDLAQQRAICSEIQVEAMADVPYMPLGQVFYASAAKKELTDILRGFSIFWNMKRA
ncbi:ABC transporter substrate-binding protein [Roseomonas chloroacetimidivorans]|uniref:ABC transporter substrate-binding protein n=1 Tax=Roseomonas chloroacetimidivorans TaxID=1766656 RepID=UPI003C72AD49